MNATITRTVAVAAAFLLIAGGAAAPTAAQSDGSSADGPDYEVSIDVEGSLTSEDGATLAVTVANGGDAELFSPVVEVPLAGNLDAGPDATQRVRVSGNGTTESRTASVQASQIRDGQSLFLFGERVPAGEERTYYAPIAVTSAGSVPITAEVRPLYNEDVAVATTERFDARGLGTLSVRTVGVDGSAVDGRIRVDGETFDGATGDGETGDLETAAGSHEVTVDGVDGVTADAVHVDVRTRERTSLTLVARDDLPGPRVVARTASASVVPESTSVSSTRPTATRAAESTRTALLATDGGLTHVAARSPASVRPVADRSVAVDAGTADVANDSGAVATYRIRADGDATLTETFEGYRLGDENRDGAVDRADAETVAAGVAAGDGGSDYADVNRDGAVTAVDAMLVAQYAEGNRNATYDGRAGR